MYHYTSRETLIEMILPTGKFRMSPLKSTNDPRESKEWFMGLEYRHQHQSDVVSALNELNSEINHYIKSGCKIACFTKDKEHAQVRPGSGFKRGFGHARMWAQYADNHKGVCIVFNKSALIETINKELSYPKYIWSDSVCYEDVASYERDELHMSYDDILEKGIKSATENHINTYYKKLFFHKIIDWADECE